MKGWFTKRVIDKTFLRAAKRLLECFNLLILETHVDHAQNSARDVQLDVLPTYAGLVDLVVIII